MPRAALPILLAGAVLAVAPASAAAFDEQGYWAFIDRMQTRMDRFWDERAGYFNGTYAPANGEALLVYSVAARSGHRGPARNDARARRLVDALVSSPPYTATLPPPRPGSLRHAPGFTSSMTSPHAPQHMVFDTGIVDGLRHAWLARRELGLSPRQTQLIVDRVHRTAHGSFYRWPAIRLNQINWYALMYAADATVTRNPQLLRRDLSRQIARFVARARGTGTAAGNLGAGLQFHYLPDARPSHPMNIDSAEYANVTASFALAYAQARRAGMRAPAPAARRLLRAWLKRVLTGYWTHGGYVNWDTGYGFRRWHQSKKFGLSQQALLGMASAPGLLPAHQRRWAKWMLDRGFDFYERQLARDSSLPGLFFGVGVVPQSEASARLALARVASNAAKAVAAGLGTARASRPPALYAYDPDTGRLAITTPDYNTAVVPTSRGAFPYGGIDVARLYDGRQEVAAGIGGRPPASFGMLVRDVSGRRTFATQIPDRGRLRLTRAPHGVHAGSSGWSGRAYAGPFQDLRAAGIARGAGWTGGTSHRFTAFFVHTTWTLHRTGARGRASVDVLFPSWGPQAEVTAVMRGGATRRVGSVRIPLRRIAHLQVTSRHGAYVVLPWRRPRGATVHLLGTRPQSSAPLAGPTLAVQIARASGVRTARFSARYAPVTRERAAETATRLAR